MKKIGFLSYLFLIFIINSCKVNELPARNSVVKSFSSPTSDNEEVMRSIAANMAEIEELYDDLFRLRSDLKIETTTEEITNNIDKIIICFVDCRKSIPAGIQENTGNYGDVDPSYEIKAYTATLGEIIKLFNLLREAAVSQDLDNYNKILYEIDDIKRKSHSRFG